MRWDFVTGWLAKAEENLAAARIILRGSLRSWDTSSFHSQQAAEKALKALLVRHQVNFPRSHDIGEILRLAEPCAPGVSTELATVRRLTPYAVEARYPGHEPVTKAGAAHHVDLAERALAYVRRHLETHLAAGRPSS